MFSGKTEIYVWVGPFFYNSTSVEIEIFITEVSA